MKISDGEKLILLMLSELYDALKVQGDMEPDFIRSAILGDKTWSFHWKYPGIPFDDQETPGIVEEVLDVLNMWSFIEASYQNLSDTEKQSVEMEAKPFGDNPKFIGFDGNNESDYMSTASFMVNQLDRYEEFKGRDFNSHCPVVDAYRRMLVVFEENRSYGSPKLLNADQLVRVLKEQGHPDNGADT